jgi:hypothetical protein
VRAAFIALLLGCSAAAAQQSSLSDLRATLLAMRPQGDQRSDVNRQTRGATPRLTQAKRQLRDWMERRLASFPQKGDEDALARDMGDLVRDAGLICEPRCPNNYLGYLDAVRVGREREFLVVRTSLGIWCGYDESAYVYGFSAGRWQRLWESEQDDYRPKHYLPQSVVAVQISSPDAAGNRLLLSLGSQPGCSSGFQPVYWRLWRISNGRTKFLLERSEFANVGNYPPVQATVGIDDVRIQLTIGGTGYGSSHEAIRHFAIHGDRVEQIDPVAPTPRDFVEEWLDAPWTRSARWSEAPQQLKAWHDKLHREDGMGDFPEPARRCSDPGLWQVATHFHDAPETYYTVRSQQPEHFTMLRISERADPACPD